MSLFPPDQPAPVSDGRREAMQALARLKQFRAGHIDLTKQEINRELNALFKFVEQVTA